MIAVFSKIDEFIHVRFFPKNKFKLIRNFEDVRGVQFEGILILPSRFQDQNQSDAYQALCVRQPEIICEVQE